MIFLGGCGITPQASTKQPAVPAFSLAELPQTVEIQDSDIDNSVENAEQIQPDNKENDPSNAQESLEESPKTKQIEKIVSTPEEQGMDDKTDGDVIPSEPVTPSEQPDGNEQSETPSDIPDSSEEQKTNVGSEDKINDSESAPATNPQDPGANEQSDEENSPLPAGNEQLGPESGDSEPEQNALDREIDESRSDSGHSVGSGKQVLAFYTNREHYLPSSYPTLMDQAKNIDWVAPFWFHLDAEEGNGNIDIFKFDTDANFGSNNMKQVIQESHQKGVKVLALIHNMLYGSSATSKRLAHEMVATPEGRSNFINDLLHILKEYNFDGVNMDVEYFSLEDRDNFSEFMDELYSTLNSKGYTVTISIPAKTGDNRSNSWSGPFDYKAIGQSADIVLIMTYDEHGFSSGPGPIASTSWVDAVLKYTVTTIPAKKILMGIPAYGFDWTVGQKNPKYISYPMAMELAQQKGQEIQWDDVTKVPYFSYTDEKDAKHEVWFENAKSLSHKLDLIDKYGIKGIGIWRIGMEDPGYWDVIKQKFGK